MTKKKTNPRKKSNAKPTDPLRCSHGELLENCPDKRHRRPPTAKPGPEEQTTFPYERKPHPFADIKAL